MSSILSALGRATTLVVGFGQGIYRGATQPCTRALNQPDLLVLVVRSDTQAPIDGLEVQFRNARLNSGTAGTGYAFFVNPGVGRFALDINLTVPQQALYRQPATIQVRSGRGGRKTVTVAVDVIPILQITAVDDHFAPSSDTCRIDYTIRGLSNQNVYLEVRSAPNNTARIYRRQLAANEIVDGDHQIEWDGRASQGAHNGLFVHPLMAPLQVRLVCAGSNSNILATKVLYHSVVFEQGTFTANGAAPNKAVQPMAWAQYKLNELGYFCGPVDNVLGPQTRRATQRYTQHAPQFFAVNLMVDAIGDSNNNHMSVDRAAGMSTLQTGDWIVVNTGPNAGNTFHIYFVNNAINFADGWGSVAPVMDWLGGPGAIGATFHMKEVDDPTLAAVDALLVNDQYPRRTIENDRMPDAGETAKAMIWTDNFYTTLADFNNVQGHVLKEQAKLDPWEYPVEVSLRLVARDDGDGSDDGIAVPAEAIGPVEIEWIVEDPAEDLSVLPPLVPPVDVPSRAHIYIDNGAGAGALPATAAATGEDNCPATNTGRRAAPADNGPYFHIGNGHQPWTTVHAAPSVYSAVHQNAGANPNKLGRAGAWFRGSYIAGDNFRIKARIALARHAATNPTLVNDHNALVNPIPEATTGTITIWRTHHVAALIDWPAPAAAVDLDAVAAHYKIAHVELRTETEQIESDTLLGPADQGAYLDLVHYRMRQAGHASARATMVFHNDALYPYAPPVHPPGTNAAGYIALINTAIGNFDDTDLQMRLSAFLYSRVRARTGPGAAVLRFKWHQPFYVRSDLWRPFSWVKNAVWWYNHQSVGSSVGLCCGLAWISNPMMSVSKYQAGFVYAHEMAHSRYMRHDESSAGGASDNPNDHDTNDHNCMMSYPWFIASRPNLRWLQGGRQEPRFCGKCVLKLRGWDPTAAALPVNS